MWANISRAFYTVLLNATDGDVLYVENARIWLPISLLYTRLRQTSFKAITFVIVASVFHSMHSRLHERQNVFRL